MWVCTKNVVGGRSREAWGSVLGKDGLVRKKFFGYTELVVVSYVRSDFLW